MLSMKVDETKCTGCGTCGAVCSLGHGMQNGKGCIAKLPKARVFVQSQQDQKTIDICRHCEMPVCVSGCVAGALYINKKAGIVEVDQDKCVGCYSCIMECPFGALRIMDYAFKCDGCKEWDKPLCASFCPTGAITAQRSSHLTGAAKRRERIFALGEKFE